MHHLQGRKLSPYLLHPAPIKDFTTLKFNSNPLPVFEESFVDETFLVQSQNVRVKTRSCMVSIPRACSSILSRALMSPSRNLATSQIITHFRNSSRNSISSCPNRLSPLFVQYSPSNRPSSSSCASLVERSASFKAAF